MDLLCKWCGETKGEEEFLKRISSEPYSQSNVRCCKKCNAEKNRKRYHNDAASRAKSLRANQAWRKNNRTKMRKFERDFHERMPNRQGARNRVRHLLRSGYWQKQPCFICGSTEGQIEAHHDSYAEIHWETVRWLCKDHHEGWHVVFDRPRNEILEEPIAEVERIRSEAGKLMKQIDELRKQYRAMCQQATALETETWNKVLVMAQPLFEDYAKGKATSPRTSSGGGLEEHTTRMSPA